MKKLFNSILGVLFMLFSMLFGRVAEFRAELKKLEEQRADLQGELQTLVDAAKAETRAMTTAEQAKFDEIEGKIKAIDATIEKEERARKLFSPAQNKSNKTAEERAELEERAFENYIRGVVSENRADVNLTSGDNGAIIPSTIANKIIKKVVDICPIYQKATRYNVGGTLTIPLYDESSTAITMAYAAEFTDLTSTSGAFTNISLTGFLAGALSKVSKSLINNSNFDVVNFVINAMAETISIWIEKELISGTTDKIAGLSGVTLKVTAAATTAITADELITLKDLVKDAYQQNGMFIMSSATRTALRLLKDTTGKYILNDDITSPFGTVLLGKPVYVSDNMDEMEAAKVAIFYGDMSGLAVKVSENVSIEVLREVFAAQHAIGVVAWLEMDSKVENVQKIAKLVMKAA